MPSVFTMVAMSFLTFQIADVVPDPAPIWSYQALGAIRNPASIGKGLALAGSEDGKVYAIRLVDGLLAYAYDAHSPVHGAPLIEPEGTAVVGSEDGFIHGFHAQNGRSLWKYATGGPIVASPTLVPGGIVVVGSTDNRIYAINPTTGKLRWVFRTGGPIETAAAIGLDGTVVVGAQDGKLYGLDPENGASRWQFDLGGLVSSGPAVDGQGRIFQVAGAGRLFVLASDGSIVTRANLPASCPTGLVLDPTDRLYFGFAEDRPAVRLGGYSSPEPHGPWNPAWSIPSTGVRGAITRPMAIGLDEVIYAVSEGGDLLTVDGRSGKVLGKTDLGAGTPSGLTLDTSGLIVVSDNSGRLRGFKARAGDWPTSGQNVQRSNRADGRLLFPGEVVELSRPPGAGMLDPELSPAGFAALAGGKIYAEQGGNFVHVRWKDENGRLLPNVHQAFISPIPTQTFEMGDEIPLPVNASLDQTPTGPAVEPTESSDDARSSLAEGAIFWHVKKRRGFAARPGSWTLVWKTAAGTRIPVRIRVRWPEEPGRYQIRVAKTPPISLTSDRFRHAETWVRDPGEPIPVNDRHLPNGLLSDDGLGRTFLILGNRPEGLALADSVGFLFVKTVAWDDPLCQATPEDVAIGSEIIPPAKLHNPEAGGPFVYREQARYCSMTGYYDRMKREGPIIPVNVDRPETQDDDMLIVYYRLGSIFEASQGEKVGAFPGWPHANRFFGAGKRHKSAPMTTKIGWPMTTVLYRANWPDPKKIKPAGHRAPGDPAEIVIARNRDPETLSESAFTHPTIYYQNEPTRPGFNPNDEHAFLSGNVVWALRDDLDTPETSAPWVLVTYTDPQDNGRAKIKLFHVVARVSDEDFRYGATAGTLIQPPNALRSFPRPRGREDTLILGPGYLDRSGNIWAKSAGVDGSTEVMVVHYRYAMQEGFFFPKAFAPGGVTPQVGDLVPWLDRRARLDRQAKNPGRVAGVDHEPIDVVLDVSWPEGTPELRQGDTLLSNRAEFRQGLPDLFNMAAVRLIYQESIAKKKPASVNLIDPLRVRSVPVVLPSELRSFPRGISDGSITFFPELPAHLRLRFYYDETARTLCVRGLLLDEGGEIRERKHIDSTTLIYPLINVLAPLDVEKYLRPLSADAGYQSALDQLVAVASIAHGLGEDEPSAAYALAVVGGEGYVTLVENDSKEAHDRGQPVSLHIIRVVKALTPGRLIVLQSGDPFSEEVVIRHSGDFGGRPERYIFSWKYEEPVSGREPARAKSDWLDLVAESLGRGRDSATIKGPGLRALQDNFVACRYRLADGPADLWSDWTRAVPVDGWVNRVLKKIEPFEQRVKDFKNHEVKTTTSLIEQAGTPYRGAIPLSIEKANQYGLFEIYETVFRRAREMSIEGSPPVKSDGANKVLLRAAGSLFDLSMALAEEASADAADPTIAYFSNQAAAGVGLRNLSDLHSFTNLVPGLLEEELALLRGLDRESAGQADLTAWPFYNRLPPNLTGGMGTIAYVNNYRVRPDYSDPRVLELDSMSLLETARRMYPQGHGDAWGHYLSAMKRYYQLLVKPDFTWKAQAQVFDLGGKAYTIDYLDERKFASGATAKAKAGLEITLSTHRRDFQSGKPTPALDPIADRAWGAGDWAARSGEGAYLDWVLGNANLPASSPKFGIEKIDRSTVPELAEVPAISLTIQAEADAIDSDLNPLGIPDGTVPFNHLGPDKLDAGLTHFEQSSQRAQRVIANAADLLGSALEARREDFAQRESVTQLNLQVLQQENELKSRLIEVFGTPFSSDIGPNRAFPEGYDGPDFKLYAKVSHSDILGSEPTETMRYEVEAFDDPEFVTPSSKRRKITFELSSNSLISMVEPDRKSRRRVTGELQSSRSELIQAIASFSRMIEEYRALADQTERAASLLKMRGNLNTSTFAIRSSAISESIRLDVAIRQAKSRQLQFHGAGRKAILVADAMSEGFPKIIGGIAGMANGIIADPTSAGRLASKFAGAVANEIVSTLADNEAISELDAHQAKELIQARSSLQIVQLEGKAEEAIRLDALRTLIAQEPILRHQLYQQQELVHQHAGRYASLLAKGNRLVEERSRLRRQTAIEIREFRYRDAAFRIFRTDALRHYRAQFDLAAFYTYMAARAYDYETNLSPDDPRRPANDPLARIVRARTLGVVGNGAVPSEGSLAGILSDLDRHFLQVRDLMNFNNPQGQRLQLSLRTGQFRIEDDPAHPGRETSAQWRQTLRRHLVPRLEDDPELVRYCGELPKGPGLVIPFATPLYLDNGRNFFGWPAGGGDVNFNPSLYGSKIRSIGVHFSGYRADSSRGLRATPYIYLIPVGADLFRTPAGPPQDEEFPGLRSWLVSDLQIPLPVDVRGKNFQGTLSNQRDLSPRKFAPFEAVYQDSYIFGEKKVVVDTQLIGRSIHNTRWLLVIPGHNLLAGRASEGLDRFIDGLPSGTQETGQGGVSDILFDIRVYSVPGR